MNRSIRGLWCVGALAVGLLSVEAASAATESASAAFEEALIGAGLPTAQLVAVLKRSNFFLEATARSDGLTTEQKKKLLEAIIKGASADDALVRAGIDKVFAGLSHDEQRQSLAIMLTEPALKAGLTKTKLEAVMKIASPMNPALLAKFGEEAAHGMPGPGNTAAGKAGLKVPGAGGGHYAGMPTQPKPGKQQGEDAGGKTVNGGAGAASGGASSIGEIISCMSKLGGNQSKGAAGGGEGGGASNPVGTSVPEGGEGNATSGKHGEPVKDAPPNGPGFGESKSCYGVNVGKMGGGQVSTWDPPSQNPKDYKWSIVKDDHAGHKTTATFKATSVKEDSSGNVTIDGKITVSKTDPSGKTKTETTDIKGATPKENSDLHKDLTKEAKDSAKKDNANGGQPTTVKSDPPKQKTNLDPDSDSQSACTGKDYNAFASCIGGSGGGKKADCDKFGQKSVVIDPSGPSSGCPSNKAMALGLLPLQKLWDPAPANGLTGAAAMSKAPALGATQFAGIAKAFGATNAGEKPSATKEATSPNAAKGAK